jgi:hypothetical protein
VPHMPLTTQSARHLNDQVRFVPFEGDDTHLDIIHQHYLPRLTELATSLGQPVTAYVPHAMLLSRSHLGMAREWLEDDGSYGVLFFTAPELERTTQYLSLLETDTISRTNPLYPPEAQACFDNAASIEHENELLVRDHLAMAGLEYKGMIRFPVGDRTPPFVIVTDRLAFVLPDLVHNGHASETMQMVLEGIPDLVFGAFSVADFEARREQARIEHLGLRFREMTVRDAESGRRALDGQISDAQSRIETHRANLLGAVRDLEDLMRQRASLVDVDVDEADRLQAEFQRLIDTGTVADFEAGGSWFSFITKQIVAEDSRTGAYHLIGRLQVRVETATGSLRFQNLDRRVDGYDSGMHAPHVMRGGEACLGSFLEVTSAPDGPAAKRDWISLMLMIIAFLESVNTSDPAGRHVHKWPFVDDPTEYGRPPYQGRVYAYGDGHDSGYEDDDDDDDEEESAFAENLTHDYCSHLGVDVYWHEYEHEHYVHNANGSWVQYDTEEHGLNPDMFSRYHVTEEGVTLYAHDDDHSGGVWVQRDGDWMPYDSDRDGESGPLIQGAERVIGRTENGSILAESLITEGPLEGRLLAWDPRSAYWERYQDETHGAYTLEPQPDAVTENQEATT